MISIERAMHIVKNRACVECDSSNSDWECSECDEAFVLAMKGLELLKEQQPRILTYEEMKTLGQNCDAVYIEQSPENSYRKCFWGLACPGVEPPKDEPYNYPGGVDFNAVDVEGDMQDGDFYQLNTPLGWRAWSGKPTEEQMKALKWE